MTGEPDNLPEGGTDNAALSETDNPETWDYYDPDDDQDNAEVEGIEGTDDEAGEAEGQETEEGSDDAPEVKATATQDAVVELSDGTKVTVKDLIAGNMRQQDYSRKTQEASELRKRLEADAQRIDGIMQAFVDHLTAMVPNEPDPSLAFREPGKYTAQKAAYDAAIAQVQKLLEMGSAPKEVQKALETGDRTARLRDENAKLAALFPATTTKEGRERFFTDAQAAAQELGFTVEDLQGVDDHRLFALAHWAKIGMDAQKARDKAKAKAAKAPPAAPVKPGQPARAANRNADAMRKLARSGSIKDAMAVDWD